MSTLSRSSREGIPHPSQAATDRLQGLLIRNEFGEWDWRGKEYRNEFLRYQHQREDQKRAGWKMSWSMALCGAAVLLAGLFIHFKLGWF